MNLVSFDLETDIRQPGLAAPPIVVGSISNSTGSHLLDVPQTFGWFKKWLASSHHLVGHNIVYDLGCLAAAEPEFIVPIFDAIDAGRVHDTGIREALIDIGKGELVDKSDDGVGIRYGLKLLAMRHLGIDLTSEKYGVDSWRLRYAELRNVPIEKWSWAARVYPLRDTALPLAIYHLQEGGLNLHREVEEVRAAWALHLMSIWGIRANPKSVAELRTRVEAADAAAQKEFETAGILRPNGTENKKHLQHLVTVAYNGDPPMTAKSDRFPGGQVATDRDTLAESGDPLLESYAKAGKNDKYLTTYLPILERGTQTPWNPSFNVLVATTRVSSDAQQFPQRGGVRECWESRPGTHYCSVDFGGLELRTMAQRAIDVLGFSKMAEVLNTGKDPHCLAGASFMGGVSYDEFYGRKKEKKFKAFRDLAKIYNFGKGGGMGPGAMVYNARSGKSGETTTGPDGRVYIGSRFCILTGRSTVCGARMIKAVVQRKERRICAECVEAAKLLDRGWLAAWPEQQELFNRSSQLSKGNHRGVTVEIPRINVRRGKCGYTQWLNTPFQGLGAAATKRAMWRISREMYCDSASPLYGSRLVLQVHDELIAELRDENLSPAAERMGFLMRDSLKEFVPNLAAAVEADPAISRTMTKSAEPVKDRATGAWIPWVPGMTIKDGYAC